MADDDEKDDDAAGADTDGTSADGADAVEGAVDGAALGTKKSKKKTIIMGLLALLLVFGGAAGAYFAGMFKHSEKPAEEKSSPSEVVEKPVYYTLPEFLVNLNTGGKSASFLKTTIVLELTKQNDVPLLDANLPRLLDSYTTYLHELRPSDLAGSAGLQRLREELLMRANRALTPVKVSDVLFKEIIAQ